METGQRFSVKGYDIVATAQAARGGGPPTTQEVILMHNHSSHYILATREPGADDAYYLTSFSYVNNGSPIDDEEGERHHLEVYGTALDFMVRIAKRS